MEELRSVGPKVTGQFAKAGVASVRDLLFHLLLRYQDRTHGVPFADLRSSTEVLL